MKTLFNGFTIGFLSIFLLNSGLMAGERSLESNDSIELRLIEPTSPVLGYQLSNRLKNGENPELVYRDILGNTDELKKSLLQSTHAYLLTLKPELDKYCENGKSDTSNRSSLTEVEFASIPLEVLLPLHDAYGNNVSWVKNEFLDYLVLENSTKLIAREFQNKRYECSTVKKIRDIENKLENFCFGMSFCKKTKTINQIVSSAEAAYPRVQYSINGFTRYIYKELMKRDDLSKVLKIIYEAEATWLNTPELQDQGDSSFFSYVYNEAIRNNIHPKVALLVLSYSTRNMPSLDVEYAEDPLKALLLETYFWSFKNFRQKITSKTYFNHVYPNYNKDPGAYHYLTASLLACEIRLAGMSDTTAKLAAYFSKFGYKSEKLLKSIDKNRLIKEGIPYVKKLAATQGFKTGLDSGEFGGEFGSERCGDFYQEQKKLLESAIDKLNAKYPSNIINDDYPNAYASINKQWNIPFSQEEILLQQEYKQKLKNEKKDFYDRLQTLIRDDENHVSDLNPDN